MPELYDFQKEDVEKIVPIRRGAIGSEMGTGKTPTAVEIDMQWYDELKAKGTAHHGTLVVAPLNTFDGWRQRYSEWNPAADVVTIDRKNRFKFIEAIRLKRGDVFLTHWEALRLMPELRGFPMGTVIADEVHRASNRKNQQTIALKMIRAHRKLALSGTMSADSPAGLWSPFHWLFPQDRFLTSYWRFYKLLVDYDVDPVHGYHKIKGVNEDKIHLLHEFMEPFWIRHLKREQCCEHHPQGVMPWLPDKVYDRMWVDLTPKQRRVYEQMKKDMLAWIGENEDKPFAAAIALVKQLRLSQIALAQPDISNDGIITFTEPSAKLDRGVELFKDESSKQFVAYTSSKQFLYLAEKRLQKSGISVVTLSGDDKDELVKLRKKNQFINGEHQVFFCMIQAAEGIDGLQQATDTAVFFDRSWSARMNNQAEDRLWRDGQKNTTQIIDIMARDTVDLGRHQHLEHKWSWIKLLLGDKVSQTTGRAA